jgi:putative hydrolase of the HAD superfamily
VSAAGARPRAVVCDFGGVLTTPLSDAFAAWHRASGITVDELGAAIGRASNRLGGENPLFELERGRLSEREFVALIEESLGGGRRLADFRDTYFAHVHRNEPMIAFMRELRERGFRMALLTNNIREWEPEWKAKLPELDEIFEVVVDSAFVGMRKPEPRIYELTLQRLGDGLRAGECLFVDDLEVNCEAARELGMTAVVFETAEQAIPQLESALAQ